MSVSPEYARASHGLLRHPITTVLAIQDEKERSILLENQEECKTPTKKEFKLPLVPCSCPGAPRKPLRVVKCKRRLSELEFVVVRREEMERLFKRRENDDGDDALLLAKKRKVNGE